MKSKMLAITMMTPAVTNLPSASAQAAATLMSKPMNVRVLGWMRSLTHTSMMSRRGNMQMRPMSPVKVMVQLYAGRGAGPRAAGFGL
jgi:hypothetical protein